MDKLKLAAFGERLKTSGAQMGRMVSGKMKEILQAQPPESKMVDEATSENLEEPNWGMNLRICAMINCEEFSGSEVVRALKKKIAGKNMVSQRLSLDLLEACAMNCEKVFSEVASEKVLDDMVKMIDNPQTHHSNRQRALQLIKAWGESEDLAYLPVFHQTYMSLKTKGTQPTAPDGNPASMFSSLESDVYQQSFSPHESYPIPDLDLHGPDHADFAAFGGSFSDGEKKEFLVVTRNSVDILSSILNSKTDAKTIEDDLTLSMLDKCKQSQPVIKRIIESTTDDEGMLFEALHLHDELQQVISKYEEMEFAARPEGQPPPKSSVTGSGGSPSRAVIEAVNETEKLKSPKGENSETGKDRNIDGCL